MASFPLYSLDHEMTPEMISEAVAAQTAKARAHLRSWQMERDASIKRVKPTVVSDEKSEQAPGAINGPATTQTSLYGMEWIDLSVPSQQTSSKQQRSTPQSSPPARPASITRPPSSAIGPLPTVDANAPRSKAVAEK